MEKGEGGRREEMWKEIVREVILKSYYNLCVSVCMYVRTLTPPKPLEGSP